MEIFKRLSPLLLSAIFLLALSPFIGAFSIWSGGSISDDGIAVIWELRLPRTLVAFLVGGILATTGLVCQALVSNSLATPTTLGVSGGASLGAGIAILSGISMPIFGAPFIGALVGAFLTTILIFTLFKFWGWNGSDRIILIGILINYLMTSLLLFIQFIAEPGELSRLIFWMIGSVKVGSWFHVCVIFIVSIFVLFSIWIRSVELNSLALGRDIAECRGVDVVRLQRWLIGVTSVGVGSVVASCGGLGFVGILEPHLCRRLVGSDFRVLVPSVFILGGSIVLSADIIGRLIFQPLEVSAGVLTSLIEIPVGLFLLCKMRR